jgi:electron transport complex protein RnfD
MQLLLCALLPGIFASLWFFGFGILINIMLAVIFALAVESIMLRLRNKAILPQLADYSAVVTAVLFAIVIPPGSPWWLLLVGILFAIVVAKHLYGGFGQNPFNPAMCGYAMLLLAFPLEMTNWHIPNEMAGDSALLAARESGLAYFARESKTGWEIINICYLLGGLFLLYKRVISWHIPISIIGIILLLSTALYSSSTATIYGTPYLHLFGGATMIGAFFIATDPVSAATTKLGKIYYGIIIGTSIYSIRVWGNYLDPIAFAILFGNFCAPLLDYYCRLRIHGHRSFQIIIKQKEASHEQA